MKQITLTNEQRNELESILKNLGEWDKVCEYNNYCDYQGFTDNEFYEIDSLNDFFHDDVIRLLDLINWHEFSTADKYWTTKNGWIVSTNNPEEEMDDDPYLVDYLENCYNDNNYNCYNHADEIDTFFEKVTKGGE